jgi:hypothetical protein
VPPEGLHHLPSTRDSRDGSDWQAEEAKQVGSGPLMKDADCIVRWPVVAEKMSMR